MLAVLAVSFLIAGCGGRRAPAPLPFPPGTEAAIAEAEHLGRIMFVHDVQAARATDEMLRIGVAPSTAVGVLGWITVPDTSTGLVVRFIGESAGQPVALYDVTFSARGVPSAKRLGPPAPLPPLRAAAFRARQTAIDAASLDCSDRYNTITFQDPMRPGDDWLVYLLPATTVPERIMVGRQLRVLVSSDGMRVIDDRPLSKDCMHIDRSDVPAKANVKMVFVVNLVSPTPNESHVFLSLLERLPIAVSTSLGTWVVDDGNIRYLGPHM